MGAVVIIQTDNGYCTSLYLLLFIEESFVSCDHFM